MQVLHWPEEITAPNVTFPVDFQVRPLDLAVATSNGLRVRVCNKHLVCFDICVRARNLFRRGAVQ